MAAFSESEGELQRLVGEASKRALTADERAEAAEHLDQLETEAKICLLYTSPSPRDS